MNSLINEGNVTKKAKHKHKHYHILERMKSRSGRKDMYKCMNPDCNFYGAAHLLEGKYAICKLCKTQYVVTKSALQLKTPHCGCRTSSLSAEGIETLLNKHGETDNEQAAVALQLLEPLLPGRQDND